jgi:hypothetical protein
VDRHRPALNAPFLGWAAPRPTQIRVIIHVSPLLPKRGLTEGIGRGGQRLQSPGSLPG